MIATHALAPLLPALGRAGSQLAACIDRRSLRGSLHPRCFGHLVQRRGDTADQDAAVLVAPVDGHAVLAVEREHQDRIARALGCHRDARHAVEVDPTLLAVDAVDLEKAIEHAEAPLQSPSTKAADGFSARGAR